MKVVLKHSTPIAICAGAIRTCWQSQDKSDSNGFVCGEKDKELIDRIGNKFKHASTLEHIVYCFHIDGISRAVLQELARHRMASLSVKSSRYTLKELADCKLFIDDNSDDFSNICWSEADKFLVMTSDFDTNVNSVYALDNVRQRLLAGVSNDIAKYGLPENYKTSLTWTINARSLQNFLDLRLGKSALWEIQNLASAVWEAIPEDDKFIFESGILKHLERLQDME